MGLSPCGWVSLKRKLPVGIPAAPLNLSGPQLLTSSGVTEPTRPGQPQAWAECMYNGSFQRPPSQSFESAPNPAFQLQVTDEAWRGQDFPRSCSGDPAPHVKSQAPPGSQAPTLPLCTRKCPRHKAGSDQPTSEDLLATDSIPDLRQMDQPKVSHQRMKR